MFFKFFVFFVRGRFGSNSDRSSEILGDSEASFVFRALATQEEAAAYEANMALEAEQELEFQRRFTGEVDVGTW